jgi:hypothetical protein
LSCLRCGLGPRARSQGSDPSRRSSQTRLASPNPWRAADRVVGSVAPRA